MNRESLDNLLKVKQKEIQAALEQSLGPLLEPGQRIKFTIEVLTEPRLIEGKTTIFKPVRHRPVKTSMPLTENDWNILRKHLVKGMGPEIINRLYPNNKPMTPSQLNTSYNQIENHINNPLRKAKVPYRLTSFQKSGTVDSRSYSFCKLL